MTTAFLGPRGTFSEVAALAHAGDDGELIAFESFPALVAAVEAGKADNAVLPIENSIDGAISTTLDLLIHETPLQIQAEIVVPVRHFLIGVPGAELNEIRFVASKPEAINQCRRFLRRELPQAGEVAALSTAAAVEDAVANGDRSRAAIGPARAAELYGGAILAPDIQDVRANVTRFVALGREAMPPTGDDKTSIAFTVRANVPGILATILAEFAREKIQLTKVESRPTKGWLGHYVFLLDLEGHRTDPPVARVLDRMPEHCMMLKIFGSYPRFPLETLRDQLEPSDELMA